MATITGLSGNEIYCLDAKGYDAGDVVVGKSGERGLLDQEIKNLPVTQEAMRARATAVRGEFNALDQSLKDNVDNVKAAQASVERYNVAKGFFETRPPMLDALREISLLFRDGDNIWVTSFTAKDDRKSQALTAKDDRKSPAGQRAFEEVTIQGKADNDKTVRALLTRMKENPNFADAQLLSIAVQEGTQRRAQEVLFSIRFSYTATE